MSLGPYRPLHWVLRVSNRKKCIDFYCNILGMTVNRHEDFKKGCEAACNGPYDNRWSKTMIGYGPESKCFNLEITYNYTHKEKYLKGNDLCYLIIHASDEVLDKVHNATCDKTEVSDGLIVTDPEGYRFKISQHSEDATLSHIAGVRINSRNPLNTAAYYSDMLGMVVHARNEGIRSVCYDGSVPFILEIAPSESTIDFKEAGGRFAISVPDPAPFEQAAVSTGKGTVHTPLVVLDTPGKSSVSVVILRDPDGSEICVVDDRGFSDLSQVDPESYNALMRDIENDKSAC